MGCIALHARLGGPGDGEARRIDGDREGHREAVVPRHGARGATATLPVRRAQREVFGVRQNLAQDLRGLVLLREAMEWPYGLPTAVGAVGLPRVRPQAVQKVEDVWRNQWQYVAITEKRRGIWRRRALRLVVS